MLEPGPAPAFANRKGASLTPVAVGAVILTLAIAGAFGYFYYPSPPVQGDLSAAPQARKAEAKAVVNLPADLGRLPGKAPPAASGGLVDRASATMAYALDEATALWRKVREWRSKPDDETVPAAVQEADLSWQKLDPALIEQSPLGPLPIAREGKAPWKAYAIPYDMNDKTVRIAVIVGELGLSRSLTETAISNLPRNVTLAFSPYGQETWHGVERARAAGHETLLSLPMEPAHFPLSDPGPYTLLTSLDDAQNAARLHWVLSRAQGYVGLISEFGERFTASSQPLLAPLRELRQRGVLIVDRRANPNSLLPRTARDIGVPRAFVDRILDPDGASSSIDWQLSDLEQKAKYTGQAVAYMSASPAMLERLSVWLVEIAQRGYALAPVTAIVNLQKDTK